MLWRLGERGAVDDVRPVKVVSDSFAGSLFREGSLSGSLFREGSHSPRTRIAQTGLVRLWLVTTA